MHTNLITPRCHSFYSGIRIYGWWCESHNANQPNTIHLVMFISRWWTLRKMKSTKFVSVLVEKRHKTSDSRENLDENGWLIPTYNQLHGAAGQVRTVGHKWRCEFCLRKWRLQLISASRWETFTKVFLLRNPSFHTGVQAKYANLWIVLEREGGVKWSVHPTLSGYVYNPIVIWRVRQPYGREMLLLLEEISRIAATVRETGSQRSKFPPPWTI